jgi:hypothetical protein
MDHVHNISHIYFTFFFFILLLLLLLLLLFLLLLLIIIYYFFFNDATVPIGPWPLQQFASKYSYPLLTSLMLLC